MRKTLTVLSVAGLAIGLAACGNNDSPFNIPVGACSLQEYYNSASTEITEAPLVDCEEEHDMEAYAAMDFEDGDYPGDVIDVQADEFCYNEFEPFVGIAYEESEIYYSYFAPQKESWEQIGDREVLCWLLSPELVTGTLEGAAR